MPGQLSPVAGGESSQLLSLLSLRPLKTSLSLSAALISLPHQSRENNDYQLGETNLENILISYTNVFFLTSTFQWKIFYEVSIQS